ncbi:hypothetical protein [Phenylobacterium sp.]|uniref:hypothetical protein n=1 Tax=Phenylobacterium sp. TaxID=1871053 RepID=UPI0025D1B1A8|nr:hypothetical protein [Phenylobacterium sp.]
MSVINGTPGADALKGTALGDRINGADGDDVVRGLGGADTLNGGAGADRIFWTRGDGSDLVEGGAGVDTQFMSGNGFNIQASGSHALVADGGETVDLHGVEMIQIQAQPGAMPVSVGDLSGTDVREVVIQLDAQHAAADLVALTGGTTNDVVSVQVLSAAGIRVLDSVNGVLQTSGISGLGSADSVSFGGGGGNDNIAVVTPHDIASVATISVHGDDGADTITGSIGAERLFGDAGDDRIVSGGGADTIDGGAGNDIQLITGRDSADSVGLSASGGHLRETVGGATSDVVNVETLNIRPLGQGDLISVGDLSTTSVRTVNIDLSGARGGQDGAADTVVLPATGSIHTADDTVLSLTSAADGSSLQAVYVTKGAVTETVNVTALGASDVIKLAGGDGDDAFSISDFKSTVGVQVDGGLGKNALGLEGTAGNDTIAVTENAGHIGVAMNGSAPIDMINVSRISMSAGAGMDTIQLGDLGGPSGLVTEDIDLSGPGGVSDGQADTVVANMTLVSGEILRGAQYGDLTRQDFTVDEPDRHERGSVYVDGMDAKDHIVMNLLGDAPFELWGPFNQTDFHLGSGDNTLNWWVEKRGHDSVDGGAGTDTLNIGLAPWLRQYDDRSWAISLTATGGSSTVAMHHVADSSPAGVTDLVVDLTHIERVSLSGGGGSDTILVGDQSGTVVKHVDIDVGGVGPDGDRDFVLLDGTAGADTIFVAQTSGDLTVNGLASSALIHNLDSSDHVFIRSGAGDDLIDLTNHNPGRGVVHLDSGLGNDTMIGGLGAESFEFHGGAGGQDVVIGFRGHALGGEADVVSVFSTVDHSVADLFAHGHIFQSGANVVLTDGAGAFLTLANVSLASLSASDFLF